MRTLTHAELRIDHLRHRFWTIQPACFVPNSGPSWPQHHRLILKRDLQTLTELRQTMCQHGRPQGSSKSQDYPSHANAEPRPVRSGLIRSVHERRLDEFVRGQFGDYNLASVLFKARTDDPKYVSIQSWTPKAGSKPTFEEAKRQTYVKGAKGMT